MRLLSRRSDDGGQRARPSLEHLVDEGVLVARSALRLAIKNRLIIGTVADARPWNPVAVEALARDAVDTLVAELEGTATRLAADATFHAHRRGATNRSRRQNRAEHQRLALRAQTMSGVVDRLRALRNDAVALSELVNLARSDMLSEFTQARLMPERDVVYQSPEERRIAMDGVKADLLELQRQRDAMRELKESGW